jgi:acetyl esterase/lipase
VPQRSKAYPSPPATPQGVKLSDFTAHFTGLTRDHRGEWRFYLIEPSDPMQARSSEGRPFMLYLHGGAYVATAQSAHFELVYDVCQRTGATILLPAYPRPPKDNVTHRDVIEPLLKLCAKLRAPASASADDGQAGNVYALARTAKNFAISGDSAGGGLAFAITMLLLREGRKDLLPSTLILNAPWLDVSLADPEIADRYDKLVSYRPATPLRGSTA